MSVRAKFVVSSYTTQLHWRDHTKELRTVKLMPVTDDTPENKSFFDATPSGSIELGVLNEAAWGQFELGKAYYVDFTPVPDLSKSG